jgi:hypothetical protein
VKSVGVKGPEKEDVRGILDYVTKEGANLHVPFARDVK